MKLLVQVLLVIIYTFGGNGMSTTLKFLNLKEYWFVPLHIESLHQIAMRVLLGDGKLALTPCHIPHHLHSLLFSFQLFVNSHLSTSIKKLQILRLWVRYGWQVEPFGIYFTHNVSVTIDINNQIMNSTSNLASSIEKILLLLQIL